MTTEKPKRHSRRVNRKKFYAEVLKDRAATDDFCKRFAEARKQREQEDK